MVDMTLLNKVYKYGNLFYDTRIGIALTPVICTSKAYFDIPD